MLIQSDHALARYYALRAEEYERIYKKPERQAELRKLEQLIPELLAGRDDVLEIACGTGYWSQFLIRSENRLTAVDINEEVLDIARHKPLLNGNVNFIVDDCYQLKNTSGGYNGGLAAFWWSHLSKNRIAEFLTIFHSKFTTGARLVFLDNNYVEGSSTAISRTDDAGNTYQTRILDSGQRYEVLKNFPTEEDLRMQINTVAGDIEFYNFKYYWGLSYTPR